MWCFRCGLRWGVWGLIQVLFVWIIFSRRQICQQSCTRGAKPRLDKSSASRFICGLVRFLQKQGGAEKSCWRPVLPVTRTDPEQINSNIIQVVVRRSMKGLLIFPWNKTLLYICFSKWSNHLTLTKCQKYHAAHKNGLSGFEILYYL